MTPLTYFDDGSLVRRVHREQVVGLSGPRALLMMAAHPVAFEGFFRHTGALEDPYERLRRTAVVMDTITWGPKAEADRLTRRVRAMHARVSGTLERAAGPFPAGTPYAAGDPELLLWILACLVDSALLVHDRYVDRLDPEQREAYWTDFKVIGRLFGLSDRDLPPAFADFQDYMAERLASPELVVTPTARRLGIEIVMRPPVPLHVRPLLELSNIVTVGLLPARLRRQYGFSWDPARALAVRGGAEYVKRVLVPLLPASMRFVAGARAGGGRGQSAALPAERPPGRAAAA
jgi:uncharacterized protein (DUF2236 family)